MNTPIYVPHQHTWKIHLSCVAQLMVGRTTNKNSLFLNSDTLKSTRGLLGMLET